MRHFSDANSQDGDGSDYSWRIALLPYVDQLQLYANYDRTEAWDSVHNIDHARRSVPVYDCPSLPQALRANDERQYFTAYAVVTGKETAFPRGKGLKSSDFEDGTSNTALVVEACGQQIVWSKPQDIEYASENVGVNFPGHQPNRSDSFWSSYHSGGAHLLLADGSARFVSDQIEPTVLNALLTPAGHDSVGGF